MKQTLLQSLTATGMIALLSFASCTKEQNANAGNEIKSASFTEQQLSAANLQATDRIDAIVKDLAKDSYSLSFDKAIPAAGITKTAYGADNYLVFADPQDVICPQPLRLRQKLIPVWKLPTIVQPTCPDYVPDFSKFKQISDVLRNADPRQFAGLQGIKATNSSVIIATDKFKSQFANLQLDRIDRITSNLDAGHFLLLNYPGNYNNVFTRNFYGYADINKMVFEPYKINLKDILKRPLIGCYDPRDLTTILKGLKDINPVLYKNLNVTPLKQDKNIAVLAVN